MISSPKETICDHLLWNNRKLIQGNQKGYFIIVQPLSTHLLTFCVMKREACLKHFCSTPKSKWEFPTDQREARHFRQRKQCMIKNEKVWNYLAYLEKGINNLAC